MLAAPPPKRIEAESKGLAEPPREDVVVPIDAGRAGQRAATSPPARPRPPNRSRLAAAARSSGAGKGRIGPGPARALVPRPPGHPKDAVPQVIPIVRPPDDPGIDDEAPADEFSEQIGTPKAQAGGWRGFLSRWGS